MLQILKNCDIFPKRNKVSLLNVCCLFMWKLSGSQLRSLAAVQHFPAPPEAFPDWGGTSQDLRYRLPVGKLIIRGHREAWNYFYVVRCDCEPFSDTGSKKCVSLVFRCLMASDGGSLRCCLWWAEPEKMAQSEAAVVGWKVILTLRTTTAAPPSAKETTTR